MSNILLYDEEEAIGKIDIDELYEKNMRRDLRQLSLFNKMLNRVHKRIQTCSRMKRDKHVWFTVPEYLFGEPTYDQASCISYIIHRLTQNGFRVQYMHPHTLFISWEEWIPQYVRNEVKKKTGKVINEKGQVLADLKADATDDRDPLDPLQQSTLYDTKSGGGGQSAANGTGKQFTPIGQYRPAGMIYNPEIFEKIEKKVSFNIDSIRGGSSNK